MRSPELDGMQNLSKYLLSRLTRHAELTSSEITNSFLLSSWSSLFFLHLNYHEAFMESNVTSTHSRNIIKSEKASEIKNIHGNITLIDRIV